MQNGTRPARHLYKVKKYHDLFRGTSPEQIEDFNLFTGIPYDQKNTSECVGYTQATILRCIFNNVNFSPDFAYAAARFLAGDGAGVGGTSFHAGIESNVAFGGLIQALAPFTNEEKGELFVSDWNNYDAGLKKLAHLYDQNGVLNVLGQGDAFDSIRSSMHSSRIPVSLGSGWYASFCSNINQGIVQTPDTVANPSAWHNSVFVGQKTINGIPHLINVSHQGNRVGDNGLLYFSRETVNAILTVQGSGALTINPNANRWISLVGLIIERYPAASAILPQLLNANH